MISINQRMYLKGQQSILVKWPVCEFLVFATIPEVLIQARQEVFIMVLSPPSGRKSSTKMEIKRFLCSKFRAVCLWNVLVNLSRVVSECFSFLLGT